MIKEIIKRIIREFHISGIPQLINRDIDVPVESGKIISIVGPRRSGKTYLMFQIMKYLIKKRIPIERILYINFEDERFFFEDFNYDEIFIAYKELYPEVKERDIYIFFDEIQNLKNWEKFIRRIYDTKTKNIFITGSNSKILSREISTSLRGRAITIVNLPLSFREFLAFKNIKVDLYSNNGISQINRAFEKYLLWGGYPEIVNFDDNLKLKVLQEYFNVMIYRDLIEKYQIKEVYILKYLIKRLFSNFTKEFSINKIYNELKAQKFAISKDKLYEFVEYLIDNYVIAVVEKYEPSVIKQELSNKKIYLYDNGLFFANSFLYEEEKGKLLENLVFAELCKAGSIIFFYRNNFECDFLIKESKKFVPIQVTYRFDRENRKREIESLLKTISRLKLKEGLIITKETAGEETIDGKRIKIQPIIKWLLER